MPLLIYHILPLTVIPALIVTYKVKNRWLLWSLILIPPFLLAPYALIPMRSPLVIILWFPAILFLPGSIIMLIVRILAFIGSRTAINGIAIMRPTITILIFLSLFAYHRISKDMADQYAITLGRNIQSSCDSNELCPEILPDWEKMNVAFGDYAYKSTIYKLHILLSVHSK
jgi:hypothetical protein